MFLAGHQAVGTSAPGAAAGSLCSGAWDPHDAHRFATTGGTSLQARSVSLSGWQHMYAAPAANRCGVCTQLQMQIQTS